ncbi:hypothetical protein KKD19_07155 [Patescibacteria group bacterium]|nr:hypothetical protein [Patescibacteria group bacterium]MBU4512981.1 hypothetical protein [Patescibacteria group bacterium]MCG2693017.1 acyl-CoA dehydratase activase [Candidatus Parcubacteria bacterium]
MIVIGIDIGSISIKMALVGEEEDRVRLEQALTKVGVDCNQPLLHENGLSSIAGHLLVVTKYQRIAGNPTDVTREMLKSLLGLVPKDCIGGIRITGSGGKLISGLLDAPFENEFRAITQGISSLYGEVKTVFEMGGETSKFIQLERDVVSDRIGIADYETSGDCAAGTGSFMDQQATRLLFKIEDVGDIVMGAGKAATIAGRCSVFAKSDMIHAQQKGYEPPEVLKGLCEAVARNFKGSITKGKKIKPPIAFIGGVAANQGVVQAMRTVFKLEENDLFVPTYYAWIGAIGAALLEMQSYQEKTTIALPKVVDLSRFQAPQEATFPFTEPLDLDKAILLRDRVKPYRFQKSGKVDAYLGLDIGSVSTKLVIIDQAGDLIYEIYTTTDARPIEKVHKGLQEIEQAIGDRITICGVGTTGSGRELIGELVGADTINDEITAHKTGAIYIGQKLIDQKVDTIFDIGGQDSKFISIQDGVVVDFTMNEACAAGTGSFLEEQAEKLEINIIGQFAEMALRSRQPIRLGERCTVFMERDLTSFLQHGAIKDDLVAGLAYSVVYNYLNRVVRDRKIGEVIYFQGGTAYNDSVTAAFSKVLGKPIIVPPHNGVVGAIGMALLAREKVSLTKKPTTFRGYSLEAVDYTIREFTCRACSNFCEMREFNIEGERTYWGDKCSYQFRKRAKVEKKPMLPDLMAKRMELLMAGYDEQEAVEGQIKIGLPRSMYFFDRFPFWNAYLKELGFKVVVSEPTNKQITEAGIEALVAEPCFPIKVAHGHITDLIAKGVDYILQPNMLNEETDVPEIASHVCPWGQTLPFVIRQAPLFADYHDTFLVPTIHFREGSKQVKKELRGLARRFGISNKRSDAAIDQAYLAQQQFWADLGTAGQEALELLATHNERAIVLVGRSYNVNDRGINMDIPDKLRRYYGVNIIPMDMLPIQGIDISDINPNMYWSYGRKILQTAKLVAKYPNLHIIYITNFKCGPDSCIKHYVREASGKPFLSLQFDEHSNDAGIMTRCEAYLDSKGFLR